MRVAALVVLTAFLLARGASAGENESVAEGPHFRVVVHFETKGLEKQALRLVESIWEVATLLYDPPEGPLERKLAVHLYRDAIRYRRAADRLGAEEFRRNVGFADYDTRTAHVALQPEMTDEVLGRTGLPVLTKAVLLHEAAHLVRYWWIPHYRNPPAWIDEGAAMWLEHRALVKNGLSAGEDEAPISGAPLVRVRRLLVSGDLPDVAAILADRTDGMEHYDVYAVRWSSSVSSRIAIRQRCARCSERCERCAGGGNSATG